MIIVQTPPRFYPYIGGTEELALQLSRELVKKGHTVKVICADEPPAGDSVLEGITVKRLPYAFKIANTNITPSLAGVLSKEDLDIIHTHLPHPWSADISACVARSRKKPLFLTYNNDITGTGVNRLIANVYNATALKFLLGTACKIFVLHAKYLETSPFLGKFRDKIVINPPGVDVARFRPLGLKGRSDVMNLFFLSRLDEFHRYKGLDYLIDAVKRAAGKIRLKLCIGGEGVLTDGYKALVKKRGLEDVVEFLGHIKNEELIKRYNQCDVFVLPSTSSVQEGFGMVAAEAMACGKPVVVTDIVGVAEDVKEYKAGIVVRPKNSGDLADALVSLHDDASARAQMGENGYSLVLRKYTWKRYADTVEKEYHKAVGRPGGTIST